MVAGNTSLQTFTVESDDGSRLSGCYLEKVRVVR